MTHTIILRTVCGCERMVAIPDRTLPLFWRVPFVQNKWFTLTYTDSDAPMRQNIHTRTFERTAATGLYGYPVYMEKWEAPS